MTKNDKNVLISRLAEENKRLKIANQLLADELTYFKDHCADLEDDLNRSSKMIKGLKLNNSKLTPERNQLVSELQSIKNMDMFEFGNRYCNESKLENAGRAFARELLGKPMTPEEVVIEAAENKHDFYTGDDF